mgnify:CR=1 FL=1
MWLVAELDDRGWSQRELARRARLSHTTISQVLSEVRAPTWDLCAQVARALGVPVDDVFILAGLKRPLPPAVAEEGEALELLRSLPGAVRATVLTILRALAGRPAYNAVYEAHPGYESDTERQLLETFRRLPDRWREIVLDEIDALEQNRLVRMIGEESHEPELDAERATEG